MHIKSKNIRKINTNDIPFFFLKPLIFRTKLFHKNQKVPNIKEIWQLKKKHAYIPARQPAVVEDQSDVVDMNANPERNKAACDLPFPK